MTATAARELHETDFFLFMHGSHRELERLAERFIAAFTADDRIATHAVWVEIEARLLAHLEAEERYVLPSFARADGKEAVALIREHGKIRELLLELGVAIELHCARLPMLELFAAMLREHASREETLMYRWASTQLEARLAASATRHVDGV